MRAKLSLAALAAFCGALMAAVWCYPGGTFLLHDGHGFSFIENFWCDLLRQPAYNGAGNGCSNRLATVAFSLVALALWPFWWEVSHLLPEERRRLVRALGSVSALATLSVPLLPSDRFPTWHAPAVLLAGGCGFICGISCGHFAVRSRRTVPWFAASSVALLLFASVNLVLYVSVQYLDGPDTVVLPAAQKLATLSLVVWMVTGLRASARLPKP